MQKHHKEFTCLPIVYKKICLTHLSMFLKSLSNNFVNLGNKHRLLQRQITKYVK